MKHTRRAALAILAGITVTGVVGAAAASFDGLDAESLGSESTVVASCDSDGIDVGFTTDYVDGDYEVTTVVFGDVDAECDTLAYSVTLSDGSGTVLGSSSGSVSLDAGGFDVAFSGIAAESVEGVALVISG